MTVLQWLHVFVGIYVIIAVLWGIFSAVVQDNREETPRALLVVTFLVNSVLCPFSMIMAIRAVYVGDIDII